MTKFSIQRQINAPVATVFAAMADFRRAPELVSGIKNVEILTDGPIGLGTRFKETRIMFKREATEIMEVVAFDPPRGYTLGATSCGSRFLSAFAFTPNGTSTNMELTFEMQPLTFFAKVMGLLMRPMLKMMIGCIAKDLDEIKTNIESQPSDAGSAPLKPQPA